MDEPAEPPRTELAVPSFARGAREPPCGVRDRRATPSRLRTACGEPHLTASPAPPAFTGARASNSLGRPAFAPHQVIMSQLGNPVLRKVASGLHRTIAFTLFGATVIGSGALLVTFGQSMVRAVAASSPRQSRSSRLRSLAIPRLSSPLRCCVVPAGQVPGAQAHLRGVRHAAGAGEARRRKLRGAAGQSPG